MTTPDMDAHAKLPNYIGLDDIEDRYVYRIMSVERLLQLFDNRKNVLVRPAMWDDPFENFILNSKARLSDGTIALFGFNNDFYGQCWTLKQASDAMWRIYSPKSDGVRVRTTVRKLAESLSGGLGNWAHVQAFIGKVSYLRDGELLDFAGSVFKSGLEPKALARTLLVKRKAFDHEKEVRLLYFEKENNPADDLFAYTIDPHAMIDQIMIDPRLPVDDVKSKRPVITADV